MTMKAILVPMVNHAGMRSALEASVLLARKFNSYIEGFALQSLVDAVAIAAGSSISNGGDVEVYEDVEQARSLFSSFMMEMNVPRSSRMSRNLSFGWSEGIAKSEGCAGSYARVFDLTIMNRIDGKASGVYERAIDSMLSESGRPLILAAPSPPRDVGAKILIYWKGCKEDARAVALAMPLIREARRVTVLSDQTGLSATGEALIECLRCNDVDAARLNVRSLGRNTGQEVLTTANAIECDLLVVGHRLENRLQMLTRPSAARFLIANNTVPLFLA